MTSSAAADFLVIDTEGKNQLSEIAILDAQGRLLYEAFTQEHWQNVTARFHVKPLTEILTDFVKLTVGKTLVFHYADHDIQLLKQSFNASGLDFPNRAIICTYVLAKQTLPAACSFSLAYLSKHLGLQVEHRYFNQNAAHSARYDAAFTHRLYLKMLEQSSTPTTIASSNPFSNSRVDNPFQQHVDLTSVYQYEFATLKSILAEIKQDPNHQSKGAVVIGEAGSGKTHLMMRLAQALLKNNRLLFIRQPNNPAAVLHHIYSRILESFIEKVPDSDYSQLEYLLAHSFSEIAISDYRKRTSLTKKQEVMLETLSADPLNIYAHLGAEGSDTKRKNWATLENLTIRWWESKYSFAGIATTIIRGLIKYCTYTDLHRRELVKRWLAGASLEEEELKLVNLPNWGDSFSLEEFSLQAIAVFGRLSIIDEPLILIFDQLEGLKENEKLLTQFGLSLKEIFTEVPNSLIILNLFPDRWATFQGFFDSSVVDRVSQYRITLNRPNLESLQEILVLKAQAHQLNLRQLFRETDFTDILSYHSIRTVLNRAADYYRYRADGMDLPPVEQDKLTFEAKVWQTISQLQQEIKALRQHCALAEPVITPAVNALVLPGPDLSAYLTAAKQQLEQEYAKNTIFTESDDVGKLLTIAEAYQKYKSFEIDHVRLGKRSLPDNVLIKTANHTFVVGFLYRVGTSFTSRLKNFNELVLQYKQYRFRVCRDCRAPLIKGKVGQDEIEKLANAANGNYYVMEAADRINYELLYKLVIDIQNRDLDLEITQALQLVETQFLKDFWLIALFRA